MSKKTINEKELEVLNFWEDNKIFEESVLRPAGAPPVQEFSFYDGPPFATGLPHYGHILAGTIKDSIPRYHTMNGKSVRRVWGWDCHGLPIENMIEKEFGLNSKKDIVNFGIDKFNKAAANSVLKYESEWKNIVPRLGRWVDMNNAYKTMDWTFTESVWWGWKELYKKDLAFESFKMMHICPRCETSLAQSEVNMPGSYKDVSDISVTIPFELEEKEEGFTVYMLAWTTTPWTLPGNSALAINKDLEYVRVKTHYNNIEVYFLLAKRLVEKVFKDFKNIEVLDIDINNYIGKKYKQLFPIKFPDLYDVEHSNNAFRIWHADFITDDAGTGIAHEAPAFGAEDMDLAKINNIPFVKHVQMNGEFTQLTVDSVLDYSDDYYKIDENIDKSNYKQVKVLQDIKVKKKNDNITTDIVIIKWLSHNGKLFSKEKLIHSYPHCWRCDTPLLNYATSSWFVDVPKIKQKLISENKNIGWTPSHVREGRFGKWLEGSREWAVSRSRYWGSPLPIWKSIDDQELKVIGSLQELADNNIQKPNNTYYVMRHATAQSNFDQILDCSGDINNHLTDNGKNQTLETLKDMQSKGLEFDIIVSSPFIRSRETAEIIAQGKEIMFDDRLVESKLGVWDKKPVKDFQNWFSQFNNNYLNIRPEGGETHLEMRDRVSSLLLDLESRFKDKKILIVSHGGPLTMLDMYINGTLSKDIDKKFFLSQGTLSSLQNAEYKKLDYKILPRDENGEINLHKPYIDKIIFKDSRGVDMKIIGDVFDCWFESGSMPFGQLHYPFENNDIFEKTFPADFIAEGMDQTRGWFYSLINLGVGLFDKSPYKNVIVNGIVLAGDGQKMSKSLKNYTDPMILVEKFGADAIRFALMNSPVMRGEAISLGDEIIEEVYKKNIARLENVLDFFHMYKDMLKVEKSLLEKSLDNSTYNSTDNPANDFIINPLDIWIKARLQQVINTSIKGYDNYELDTAVSDIPEFIDDLSTWYLRRSRDRFRDGDFEAINTMKYVLLELSKVIAPSMPFLSERIYKSIIENNQESNKNSVHLQKYPIHRDLTVDEKDIISQMKQVRNIVAELLMLRQKSNLPVRQPLLEAILNQDIDQRYFDLIKEELNVKNVIVDIKLNESSLNINITEDLKIEGLERDWIRKINDERKSLGLVYTDLIRIILKGVEDYDFISKSQNIISSVNITESICDISKVDNDKKFIIEKL